MTVITIAASVVLPAQLDSGSRDPRLTLASQAGPPTSDGVGPVTTITVVAAREARSSTGSLRIGEAVPRPGRRDETTSSAIVRVSSAAK
jgi:hypothetical protein